MLFLPAESLLSPDTYCLVLVGQVTSSSIVEVESPDRVGVGTKEVLGATRGSQVRIVATELSHL